MPIFAQIEESSKSHAPDSKWIEGMAFLDCTHNENPNLFSTGEGFGFFVFFGNENNGSFQTAVCQKPYQKKDRIAKVTNVRVPQSRKDTSMKSDERACQSNMNTDCVELLLRDGRKLLSTSLRSRLHWMSPWHSGLNWITSSKFCMFRVGIVSCKIELE